MTSGQGVFIAVMGFWALFFGGIGTYFAAHNLRLLRTAQRRPGKIVMINEEPPTMRDPNDDGPGRPAYRPIVEFTDEEGTLRRCRGSSAANPTPYVVGQSISLLFDPADPKTVHIHSFDEMWTVTLVLLGIGAACLLLVAGILIWDIAVALTVG